MQSIISKLNALKSIEPEKSWVVETRKKVLSETPVLGWKVTEIKSKQENKMADKFFSRSKGSRDGDLSRLYGRDYGRDAINRVCTTLFSKRLAVSAFTLVFLVSGGAFTVEASKSSLPGDSLYIVKITAEDVTLAVASKEKRPEIEIGQAGRRLEELSEISKKSSDGNQSEKTKQLLASFEKKINSAQSSLIEIENNNIKAKVAKVINVQTEKYTEVLTETRENLPDVVGDEVSEKFDSVAKSNEKVNFQSLATRVKLMTDKDKEEITAVVKKKAEEKITEDEEIIEDAEIEEGFDESDSMDQDVIETETGAEEKSTDDVDSTENDEEESEETEGSIEEDKKELLGILDGLNNPDDDEGDVEGDNCVCEIDVECDCADAGDEGEESEDRSEGDEGDDLKDENLEQ